MARETQLHYLPSTYDGRCQGSENVNYVNSFVSFGGSLPEDEVLHKFEMRLPIPQEKPGKKFDAEVKDLFNFTASDFISKSLSKILTDVDEIFKGILFGDVIEDDEGNLTTAPKGNEKPLVYGNIPSPSDAGPMYDERRHLAAQRVIDEWRYAPKKAGKSVTVASFIQKLVASGKISADDAEGIETQAELFEKLSELGVL